MAASSAVAATRAAATAAAAASAVAAAAARTQKASIDRRLYRSLLRACRPFCRRDGGDPTTPFSQQSPSKQNTTNAAVSTSGGAVLACLLHRTGLDDDEAATIRRFLLRRTSERQQAAVVGDDGDTSSGDDEDDEDGSVLGQEERREILKAAEEQEDRVREEVVRIAEEEGPGTSPSSLLFRKLLRQVIGAGSGNDIDCGGTGGGIRQMVFPSDAPAVSAALRSAIRREFRCSSSDDKGDAKTKKKRAEKKDDDDDVPSPPISRNYDAPARREAAFTALRELNKKLRWADELRSKWPKEGASLYPYHPQQAARFVDPLPTAPPSSYLRPGAYLIAHPNLTGYFRRSVICILDHREEIDGGDQDAGGGAAYGTYGLIVNRPCLTMHPSSNPRRLTLRDVIQPLPEDLTGAFGNTVVKDGGPVHVSLQMLHCATSEVEDAVRIGGHPLAHIPPPETAASDGRQGASNQQSPAVHTDRAVYYKGDIIHAANAVLSGNLDREDCSFFVGASSWAVGQLEGEIERGCWLPCRGPPEIAHSGICDHEPTPKGSARPKADLWLSMLSACGKDEAELAHLVYNDDGNDELGAPCDDDLV